MRYLSIDHGQKRTGLAICDAGESVVSPYSVIETSNKQELLRQICSVIKAEQIEALVIGLPLNMDGTEGPRAQQVRIFANCLCENVTIPIEFCDERLSSFEADKLATVLELTRKKKKKRLDAIAAAEILRTFLASKSS